MIYDFFLEVGRAPPCKFIGSEFKLCGHMDILKSYQRNQAQKLTGGISEWGKGMIPSNSPIQWWAPNTVIQGPHQPITFTKIEHSQHGVSVCGQCSLLACVFSCVEKTWLAVSCAWLVSYSGSSFTFTLQVNSAASPIQQTAAAPAQLCQQWSASLSCQCGFSPLLKPL